MPKALLSTTVLLKHQMSSTPSVAVILICGGAGATVIGVQGGDPKLSSFCLNDARSVGCSVTLKVPSAFVMVEPVATPVKFTVRLPG